MTDHNDTVPTKRTAMVTLSDWPTAVTVPNAVVRDPKLSLADLGLYAKLAGLLPLMVSPCPVDDLVTQLLWGAFGHRADVSEESIRVGIQRLIDAGHLEP